jgi:serine-type D-Ala-D-Ala carboxypeptidase/endopeptidase (penicillin-binding protein 4)
MSLMSAMSLTRAIIFIKLTTLVIVLSNCSPSRIIKNNLTHSSDSLHHHAGFVLYDPLARKNLVSINSDKYFTPASNTKIFTLFAGLKILGDSVPALRWINQNDSVIFWGTGDPSFLYQEVFNSNKTFAFLQQIPGNLFFSDANFFDKAYGPGWSWDDYQDYYQAERSAFPIYGNLISISRDEGLQPAYFKNLSTDTLRSTSPLLRDLTSNATLVNKDKVPKKGTRVTPFITSGDLTSKLLSDTLNREVCLTKKPLPKEAGILFSMPVDSLYMVMMQASDNFIAEQILLICSQKISDSLKAEIAIKKVTQDFLLDLPDEPIWVDGSGLSRYNQFTPRSIVKLWEKIYGIVPQQRLFALLTSNGKNGTLRNLLKGQPAFIYGKTGSLSNNYCLSGYLVTRKNRLLIFSSMNANFVSETKFVRNNLAKTLQYIYEHY